MKRFMVFVLSIAFILNLGIPVHAFETSSNLESSILYQSIDSQTGHRKSIETLGDAVIYVFQDEDLTFVSQITNQGTIRFSYIENSNGQLKSSALYNIEDICNYDNNQKIKARDIDTLENINQSIIENLYEFNSSSVLYPYTIASISGIEDDPELAELLEEMWGPTYGPIQIDSTTKIHNNISYVVYCNEIKATYLDEYTLADFAAQTPVDVVIAWILSGGNWISAGEVLLERVVTLITVDGAYYIEFGVTLKRASAILSISRFVTIDNDDQAWTTSSWTKKVMVICGQYGWQADIQDYYDEKHALFSDTATLMNYGFDAFVSSML